MANAKQYASVSELLHDILSDKETREEFDTVVAQRRLIKQLIAMRAAMGMSQEDVAARMGCTQGSVSKLENSKDNDVRLGSLRAYAKAVGCELAACAIPQDITPVQMVKCHTIAIKKHADDLARLARTDETIAEGVTGFFVELFANFMWMLGDSAKRLPAHPDGTPRLRVEAKFEASGDEDPDTLCCLDPARLIDATP